MKLAGSAIILAGGQSRRMGRDKAELPWGGTTLLEHISGQMTSLFEDVLVIHGEKERALPGVRCVRDDGPSGQGPLAGLLAGLRDAVYPWTFVTACDMPFLEPALVRFLWSRRSEEVQAVIPLLPGGPQPLLGCYSGKALVNGRIVWERGERSPQKLLQTLSVRWVREWEMRPYDPTLRSFTNVNTQEDYAHALF